MHFMYKSIPPPFLKYSSSFFFIYYYFARGVALKWFEIPSIYPRQKQNTNFMFR